jgi:hypothetical protein
MDAAERAQKNKELQEQLKTLYPNVETLPALEGSEKQVKWANDIRKAAIGLVIEVLDEELKYEPSHFSAELIDVKDGLFSIYAEKSAKWWIDSRRSFQRDNDVLYMAEYRAKGRV